MVREKLFSGWLMALFGVLPLRKPKGWMGSVACAALVVALPWPGHSQTMEEVIAGAKKEGQVRVGITVRKKEGKAIAAPRLIEAFEKRYPFVKVHYRRIGGSRERERVFTELAGGMVNFDVATLSQTSVADGMKAKIFRKVGWKGLGLRPEAYHPKSIGVNYRTQLYGISYNTKLLPRDVGQKLNWESCTDPRWKGKFALDVRPRHLEVLYQDNAWGREKTLEYARRLAANKPVLERSRLEAETKLAAGSYPFVCGAFWSTNRRLVLNEDATHLEFMAPEPVVVSSGDIVFVPAGAKNPYAGILWLVWSLSDEAMKILDEVQFTADPMVPGSSANPLLKGKKVVRGLWEYQVRSHEILNNILEAMGFPLVR